MTYTYMIRVILPSGAVQTVPVVAINPAIALEMAAAYGRVGGILESKVNRD